MEFITYFTNRVVIYTASNAQRFTAAKDVANNIQFATAASYVPPGGLSRVITGQISGSFGGITESHTFNNSLEYTSTQATSTAGTAMSLTLNYNLTGGDNGTVTGITNNVDNGRTQTLTYDPLNRILSAQSSATTTPDCWGQVFGPDGSAADDAVANLTKINSGTQTQPTCPYGMLSATVDANNHITTDSTYAYDTAGNMTKDGTGTGYSYSFDDENRLTIATGFTGGPYCYVYDGNGLRVAKKSNSDSTCTTGTVTKLYWRSISGDAFAETDASGNTQSEYVFFGGKRMTQINLASLDVRFTNDSCSGCNGGTPVGGGDRNLFINSVSIASTTILPNDPSVSYVGAPCNGPGGLYCNGDMIVNKSLGAPGQTITVNAYGSTDYNIYPHMQLLLNGVIVGEWDVTGSAQNYSLTIPSTAILYYFADQVGSTRTITDANGNLCYDADFTPYGQEISYTTRLQATACPPNYKFTGYERDPETGLDYAFARYYSSRLGRFLSTDPLGGAIGNLQSHNAYAYVMNNPLALTDALGLDPCQGANVFQFSQDANGTGIFTPQDCAANGGTWSQGSGCVLDGADVPRGFLVNLLSSPGNPTSCAQSCGSATGPGIVAMSSVNYSQDPDLCIPYPYLCTTYIVVNLGVGNGSIGGNSGGANPPRGVACNPNTDICVPASALPPPGAQDPLKKAIKWYLCGKNAADNIGNYMLEGGTKSAIFGAFTLTEAGPPGVVAGAMIGGTVGIVGGGLVGSGASLACWLGGAYH
jgi:RHS repeat-associated protein